MLTLDTWPAERGPLPAWLVGVLRDHREVRETEPCAYGCGDPNCSQGRKCQARCSHPGWDGYRQFYCRVCRVTVKTEVVTTRNALLDEVEDLKEQLFGYSERVADLEAALREIARMDDPSADRNDDLIYGAYASRIARDALGPFPAPSSSPDQENT